MTITHTGRLVAALLITATTAATPALAAPSGTRTACDAGPIDAVPAGGTRDTLAKGQRFRLDGRSHVVAHGHGKGRWVHGTRLAGDGARALSGWTKAANLCP